MTSPVDWLAENRHSMRMLAKLLFRLFIVVCCLCAAPNLHADAPPPLAPVAERADAVVLEKAARRLTLFRKGAVIGVYDIALGFEPAGDKQREGDGRTPEGRYVIDRRNPNSSFHLSLGISYPDAADRAAARAAGVDPGGDIFIHGQPNALSDLITLPGDWTAGCAAVSNAEIEEIWRLTPIGAPIEIRP